MFCRLDCLKRHLSGRFGLTHGLSGTVAAVDDLLLNSSCVVTAQVEEAFAIMDPFQVLVSRNLGNVESLHLGSVGESQAGNVALILK